MMVRLQARHGWSKFAGMVFLLLSLLFGAAHHANGASALPQGAVTNLFTQASAPFAIADFDGDSKPDLATVQVGRDDFLHASYSVDFHLSGGSRQSIHLMASAGGLQITSLDVNGDSFPDVIVATAWTNHPVAVLLNDGHGNFIRSDPSVFPAAMQSSQNNWACATHEIKDDAAALLLSRSFAGNCESLDRFAQRPCVTAQLVPSVSRPAPISPATAFLNRGPPLPAFFLC